MRLRQRLLHQHGGCLVVQDVALGFGPGVGQAVLAVAGKRVQRHIGHDAQLGKFFFQGAHHAGHQAVRVERLGAVIGF